MDEPEAVSPPAAGTSKGSRRAQVSETTRKVLDHRAALQRGAEEKKARPAKMPPPRQLLKDLASLSVMEFMSRSIPYVPPALRDQIGTLLGALSLQMLGAEATILREELHRSFAGIPLPKTETEILKGAFRNFWLADIETNLYPHLDEKNINDYIVLEGKNHLDSALQKGKGAILLIGHFGMNQLTMAALGHRGYPMNQLSAPPHVWSEILGVDATPLQERKWRLIWEKEQRLPAHHISVFGFLRPAFECLDRNEVLCLAIDGGGGNRFTQVDFLGRRCNVAATPMSLAGKTSAPVLPGMVLRTGGGRHRLIIEPPIEMDRTRNRDSDLQRNTQRYMAVLERWVRRHPDHYLYFLRHRRKTSATDAVPFFEDYSDKETRHG